MSDNKQAKNTEALSLFAILLGCKPKGRNVEQHDVMFGVAGSLNGLSDTIKDFWYSSMLTEIAAKVSKISPAFNIRALKEELHHSFSKRDKVHIDAWTRVSYVDGYKVIIKPKTEAGGRSDLKLFFINLGGYKENEFEEFHKKMFVVATAVSEALQKVMEHNFFKEYSPENLGLAGSAHLDDQYKIDFEADDIICVSDAIGSDYVIELQQTDEVTENEMIVGYTHITYPDE